MIKQNKTNLTRLLYNNISNHSHVDSIYFSYVYLSGVSGLQLAFQTAEGDSVPQCSPSAATEATKKRLSARENGRR